MKVRTFAGKLSFVLVLVCQTFANTYGPTVPEVSKFEPFDATNLVDLYTGDFVYTLPIMEIPGGQGGYPIALSYKAGVPTNDVSSWVGLGWNLTPGFINRHVAGLPDDLYRGDILRVTKDKFSQHFGVGIKDIISVGGQYDNTQGFSAYLRFKLEYEFDYGKTEVGLTFDRSGMHFGQNTSLFGGWVESSSGISIATNGISSTSRMKTAAQGIPFTISSATGNPYIYASGQAYIFEFGFGQQCGTYEVQSYGQLYADEMIKDADADPNWSNWQSQAQLAAACLATGYKVLGSVISDYKDKSIEDYFIGALLGDWNPLSTKMYQTESITEKLDIPALSLLDPSDSKYQRPHLFLSKDGFSVNAQGLNGAMASYRNKRQIVPRTDIFNRTPTTGLFDPLGNLLNPFPTMEQLYLNVRKNDNSLLHDDVTNKHKFRFIGEPGGTFLQESNDNVQSYGSKKVVYYTDNTKKHITGFSVTKEDGVVYHFKKPAYSTLEVAVSLHTEDPNLMDIVNTAWATFMNAGALWPATIFTGEGIAQMHGANVDYAMSMNDNKYAYAWYLTAITGPDFVDMDGNDQPGSGDLGYWVRFNYNDSPDIGAYEWREPVYGFRPASLWDPHTDAEKLDQGYACGKKEIYYLNSIETNTHVAVCQLSERKDAYACQYDPGPGEQNVNDWYVFTSDLNFDNAEDMVQRKRQVNPLGKGGLVNTHKPLKKLDGIKLYKRDLWNDDGDHIVEAGEISGTSTKEVEFAYNYALCKGTRNSNVDGDDRIGDLDSDGKLTLKEVRFKGTGGTSLLPPYMFAYDEYNAANNPNFSYANWDRWGYYKSDGNLDHLATNANDVDAWSLRSIVTPMGAKLDIEYESDDYARVQNRLAEDALKYEGDEVRVEYITGDVNGQPELIGMKIPEDVAKRLRTGDKISLYGRTFRIKPFQTNYTTQLNQIVDDLIEQLEDGDAKGWDAVYRILAVNQLLQELFQCSIVPLQCSACEAFRPAIPLGGPCAAPISCSVAYYACLDRCAREARQCVNDVTSCTDAFKNGLKAALKNRATILVSSLLNYSHIAWEGTITVPSAPANGYVTVMFDGNKPKIAISDDVDIINAITTLNISSLVCGSGSVLDPFSMDRKQVWQFLGKIIGDTKLGDGIRDIVGEDAYEVLFPMTSAVENVVGNNLFLRVTKLPPSNYEHPSGSGYTNIVNNLRTRANTDPLFNIAYYPVKKGGGLRVRRLTLNDVIGGSRAWQYFYDFLGDGTGRSSGVATSEPMPYGTEGMDDRCIRQEEEGNFYVAAPAVGYEKITVRAPDGSKVVSEFATPWDYPYVSRRGGSENGTHKYYDPSTAYGKLKTKKYFSAGTPARHVYTEEYQYQPVYYPNTQLDPSDGNMGQSVTASNIPVKSTLYDNANLPIGAVRTTYDSYLMDVTVTNFIQGQPINVALAGIRSNSYQYDVPGFPLKKVLTTKDGVTKEMRNFLWDKYTGTPLCIAEKNSDGKWKVTEKTPAYLIADNWPMTQDYKNMLTQEYQNTTYEYSGSMDLTPSQILAAATPVASEVQRWSDAPSARNWMTAYSSAPGQWYKYETWRWRTDNSTPNKSVTFSSTNGQWVLKERISKYDRYGEEVEIQNAAGTFTGVARGHRNELVSGVVDNANFREFGILTGEYDDKGAYIDYDDAWERGEGKADGVTLPSAASVTVCAEAKHFGQNGLKIRNAFGPSRNFKLKQGRNYVLSAWIKPVSGNPPLAKNTVIGIDYRKHNGSETWPLTLYSATVSQPIGCTGALRVTPKADGWSLIELDVPAAKDIPANKWSEGYQYARMWVGVPAGNGSSGDATVYVDDIRFYPVGSLAKSFYHDPVMSKPIAFVDENSSGKYFTYDPLARLTEERNNQRNLVKKYEYYVMGPNHPPTISNGQVTKNGNLVTLSWVGGDPDGEDVLFRIQVSGMYIPCILCPPVPIERNQSLETNGIAAPREVTISFPNGCFGVFPWQIEATDKRGERSVSTGWSFEW